MLLGVELGSNLQYCILITSVVSVPSVGSIIHLPLPRMQTLETGHGFLLYLQSLLCTRK